MKVFIKSLLVIFVLLGAAVTGLSRFVPGYHLTPALVALGLMALNALAAIAVLHLPGRDPIRTPLISMTARLIFLGGIMLAGMKILRPSQPEAFSFVFTAMAGFIAFQALEIRHVMNLQGRAAR